ncbi:MAG: hypothetical protein MJ191_00160 [Clostridium sp.]|nr:hypothetical protein [Clostridium sp.]
MLKQKMVDLFNEKLAGEMFEFSEVVSYFDLVIDEINADLSSTFPTVSEFNRVDFPDYKLEEYIQYDENGDFVRDDQGEIIVDWDALAAVYNNYDVIPEKYIRSVIIPGAAYKWFSVDEEGASTAPLFQQEYEKARFEMLRDYIDLVPYEFQNDLTGAISDPFYYHKLRRDSETFGVF